MKFITHQRQWFVDQLTQFKSAPKLFTKVLIVSKVLGVASSELAVLAALIASVVE